MRCIKDTGRRVISVMRRDSEQIIAEIVQSCNGTELRVLPVGGAAFTVDELEAIALYARTTPFHDEFFAGRESFPVRLCRS